jgi:hypothetical protein
MSGGNGGVSCRPWIGRVREGKARPTAAAGDPRVSACAGSRRGARNRATVRAGGNGGAAAACGSAAGDDRYGAGLGIPATPGDFLASPVICIHT